MTGKSIAIIVSMLGLFLLLLWGVSKYRHVLSSSKKIEIWNAANSLVQVTKPDLLDQHSPKNFRQALEHSISYYRLQDANRIYNFGADKYTTVELLVGLEKLLSLFDQYGLVEEFFRQVQANFNFYSSASEQVLFTGYYEPRLNGSIVKTERFRYPIYNRPKDLHTLKFSDFPGLMSYLKADAPSEIRVRLNENKIVPYFDRQQIDYEGKLTNRNLELVWVDDVIDLFFLQIQGSGTVQLPNGEEIRVGYAEKNGHPYRPIGKLLLEQGKLTKGNVSMQSIKAYLRTNPSELQEVFNYNPSYVFFRKLESAALGSIGQPVTAYRSIATDSQLFPPGALAFVELALPEFDTTGKKRSEQKQSFLVFNQDTGGAIKTPARADLFTGSGSEAELVAGHLATYGRLFFLAPLKN